MLLFLLDKPNNPHQQKSSARTKNGASPLFQATNPFLAIFDVVKLPKSNIRLKFIGIRLEIK